jgi:hypothetical protein
MSKQTAVEWLEYYIQIEINKYRVQPMDLNAIHALNHIKEFACSKAKQMEKEQLEDVYLAGEAKDEKYYKETYERENNKH